MRSKGLLDALARAVRRRRKSLDVTQIELSRLAGCGPVFVYDLERGKPTVRIDKLLSVLVVLGLRLTLEPGHDALFIAESLREEGSRG